MRTRELTRVRERQQGVDVIHQRRRGTGAPHLAGEGVQSPVRDLRERLRPQDTGAGAREPVGGILARRELPVDPLEGVRQEAECVLERVSRPRSGT